MTHQELEKVFAEIDKIAENPHYSKNWKMFSGHTEKAHQEAQKHRKMLVDVPLMAKMLAKEFSILDMPEVLKNTKIRPFGREAMVFDVSTQKNGEYGFGALGFSFRNKNRHDGSFFPQRSIFVNQFYDEQERFDFADFAVEKEDFAEDFDRLRREEITSENKFLENALLLVPEDEEKQFKKELKSFTAKNKQESAQNAEKAYQQDFRPKARLKPEEQAELFWELEGRKTKKQEKQQQKLAKDQKQFGEDLYEIKTTILHEWLHGLCKREGAFWGGVAGKTTFQLHEGMTEWLTMKVVESNKKFFLNNPKTDKPECFQPYKPFVAYAEIMNTIFPGCVEDVYFNGKEKIKNYKIEDVTLESIIHKFPPIEKFDKLETTSPFEVKQVFAMKVLKNFLELKDQANHLMQKNLISKSAYEKLLLQEQICFDSLMENRKCPICVDLKTQEKVFGQNKQKKQRQEFFENQKTEQQNKKQQQEKFEKMFVTKNQKQKQKQKQTQEKFEQMFSTKSKKQTDLKNQKEKNYGRWN